MLWKVSLMNRLFQGNGQIYACGHKRDGNQARCLTCFPKVKSNRELFEEHLINCEECFNKHKAVYEEIWKHKFETEVTDGNSKEKV